MTFTPAQLAKHLQVSRSKIMGAIRTGELAAVNLGSGDVPRYRITAEALEQFLDSRKVKPAAKRQPSRRITTPTKRDYFPDL